MKSQIGLVNKDHIDTSVKDLLRQILECIGEDGEPNISQQSNGASGEVVLEVQVDGACYTLTRTHSEPQLAESQTSLSPREQEIVRLVTNGLPNKAIAAVLEISPWTVATHLRRVYSKLGVNCRAEMVARVLRDNLIGGRK